MTDHDPRAWRVATALAHESGLDWALWARSRIPDPDCDECCGRGGRRDDDVPDQWYPCECLRDVPAPWDTEAYLADCRRRGVEPGPLPSLEWTGDDGFGWKVDACDVCRVRVDFVDGGDPVASWYSRTDVIRWLDVIEWREYRSHARTLVERIADLARVAAEAIRG